MLIALLPRLRAFHTADRLLSTSAEALFPRLARQWLIFALLAGWVVLAGREAGFPAAIRRSLKLFRALLILAAAYFIFEVCLLNSQCFSAVDAPGLVVTALGQPIRSCLRQTDITGLKSLAFSYAVLALRFAAEVLPTLLAAATAYFAIGLRHDGRRRIYAGERLRAKARRMVSALKLSAVWQSVNACKVCAPLILSTSIRFLFRSEPCLCLPRLGARPSSRTSPLRRTTTSLLSEGAAMAITVHLDEVLKVRGMTSKELWCHRRHHGGKSFHSAQRQGQGRAFATLNWHLCALECNERYSQMRRTGGRA